MKIKNKSYDYAYNNKIFTILLSLNIFLTVLTLTGYAHPLAIFMGAYLTILLTIFAPFNLKESCHFIKKNRINIINKLSHIEKSLYDLKESDFIKSASAQTAYQQKNDFNRQLDNLKTNLIDYKNDIKYLSKPRKVFTK